MRRTALDIYELLIQTDFAAAHRLREYEGNCERLHGHNWKVDIALRAGKLDALGMAMDFREAKRLVRGVLDQLDHRYLNDLEAFRERNPTTEHIARLVYEELAARLPEGIAVAKVTAWESDHCGVSYSRTP
ncbi:MAG: 6-carboxytetrahydropterin synthase QueD [Candidatus Brocadiia bacterium]